jgi:HSP20 family protein
MITRFSDYDTFHPFGFGRFDQLRRDMARLMDAFDDDAPAGAPATGNGARLVDASVFDTGKELVFTADLPGMSEKDLKIELANDVLTIQGRRTLRAPEGYSAHHQ